MRRYGGESGTLLWLVLLVALMVRAETSDAATWYAANNGSGTTCTDPDAGGTACTPAYAAGTKANPGDMVVLKNGYYSGGDYMLTVWRSGLPGAPTVVRAEADGGVVIDGQQQRQPLSVYGKEHLEIEGLVLMNGEDPYNGATALVGDSKNITLRRCSAIDLQDDAASIVLLHVNRPNGYGEAVVLEDVAVIGSMGMINTQGSEYGVVRRVYTRGREAGVYLYNSNRMLVENLISTRDSSNGDDPHSANGPHTNDLQGNGNYNRILGLVSYSDSVGVEFGDVAKRAARAAPDELVRCPWRGVWP